MELTKEQIEFLDNVCVGSWKLNSVGEVDVNGNVYMSSLNLTEIPVKFGSVADSFYCSKNHLTTLKNAPKSIGWHFWCYSNNLTNYFKNIKEEDFLLWDDLYWDDVIREYPFLINICRKYRKKFKVYLDIYPQTKIYLE